MARVPEVGARVRSFCERSDLEESALAEIELCVVEALNNAIEHALGFRDDGELVVLAMVTAVDLIIEITDCGLPIPDAVLKSDPESKLAFDADDIESLPERGFGLAIMRQVMDEVSYRRHDRRNTLLLVRHLSRVGAPT
jgi:serine/threonine-protein kinase RsbW